jgi:hypothetical protein
MKWCFTIVHGNVGTRPVWYWLTEAQMNLRWSFLAWISNCFLVCRLTFLEMAFCCRHSFEYFDKEDAIIAHLDRGIDASIKISSDWPLCSYGLKLISICNSGTHPTNIASSLLTKTKVKSGCLWSWTAYTQYTWLWYTWKNVLGNPWTGINSFRKYHFILHNLQWSYINMC